MTPRQTALNFTLGYTLVALLAYYLQSHMLFSSDVAYLMHAANILLAGGKYVTDIFETNPPMILYLYFPVCIAAKMTMLDIILVLRVYMIVLAFISSALCFYLLKKIIRPADQFLGYFLLGMIWVVFLYLPMFETGQREHFLTLLMLPYLLLVVAKLSQQKISSTLSLFIGFLAGLGFALKPFFLITLCLVELYVMLQRRSLFAWLRAETLMIIGVIIAYLCILVLQHKNYLHVILPLLPYYFSRARESWYEVLTRPLVIYTFVAVLSYFIFYQNDRYRTLNTVIWLSLIGMIVAFLIPQTSWFYHVLPALSLACLLLASYLGQTIPATNIQQISFFAGAFCLLYAVPLFNAYFYTYTITHSAWNKENEAVINFINAQPGAHRTYCFTTNGTVDCFPLINLTRGQFGGRFPFFWWVSIFNDSSTPAIAQKNFLLNAVADDLNHFQPEWIIVADQPFGILNKFSENKNFRRAWQHYHLIKQLHRYQIYTRAS